MVKIAPLKDNNALLEVIFICKQAQLKVNRCSKKKRKEKDKKERRKKIKNWKA